MSASQLEVRSTLVAGSRPGPAPEKVFRNPDRIPTYRNTEGRYRARSVHCDWEGTRSLYLQIDVSTACGSAARF